MSDKNEVKAPCSVCQGSGKPGPNDQRCICGGAGTHEAEVDNLRSLADALRATFNELQVFLAMKGYTCSKPSQLLPAIEKLYERCVDAEDEFVKLKRQRVR